MRSQVESCRRAPGYHREAFLPWWITWRRKEGDSVRILVITPHPARFPGGGSPARVYYLTRALAAYHTVDLIAGECWGGGNTVEQLSGISSRFAVLRPATWMPSGGIWTRRLRRWWRWAFGEAVDVRDVSRLKAHIRSQIEEWGGIAQYDLVYIHHSMTYAIVEFLEPKSPVVIDLHNVMHAYYLRNFRVASGWTKKIVALREYLKLRFFERRLFLSSPRFVCCSHHDRGIVEKINPLVRASTIENGVDCDYFSYRSGGCNQTILFLGTLSYPPNSEAVLFFVKEIWPTIFASNPGARFQVIGLEPPQHILDLNAIDGVEVVGEVPDIRPHAQEAAIHVVPLRSGSGTRLKILEALAMGRAVVSTPVGAEGLELRDGHHAILARSPSEFAEQVLRLTQDREMCTRLGRHGAEWVREHHDWKALGEKLAHELPNLVRPGG